MGPGSVRALNARGASEASGMAVAVQANVAQLRIAQSKRAGAGAPAHDIGTPSPGAVKQFRETLIDWKIIKAYTNEELALRLHEVWGQFCIFCWLFGNSDPHDPPRFAVRAGGGTIRGATEIFDKSSEIERGLWRMRHEQRLRTDAEAMRDAQFAKEAEAALDIPVMVYGQNVRVCGNEDLVRASCEFAGMLAASRWAGDDHLAWGQEGIMDVVVSV